MTGEQDPNVEPQVGGQNPPEGGNQPPAGQEPQGNQDPQGGQEPQVDFSQFTGGKFKSWEEVQSEIERRDSKISELESREPSYYSDTTKAVDEMLKSGASQDEVYNFIRLQTMPIDDMGPAEQIKMQMQFENPNLSASDIDLLFEETYRPGVDEDDESYDRIKRLKEVQMKKDSNAARKFLNDKKLAASEPPSIRNKKAEEAKRQQLSDSWDNSLNIDDTVKFPVSFKDKDTDYSFDLEIKSSEEVRKTLLSHAIAQGMEPTRENIAAIAQMAPRVALVQNLEANLQAIARDAYAKGAKAKKAEVNNNNPVQRPEGRDPIKPEDVRSALQRSIFEKRGR